MMLSVVIPVYNEEKTIFEILEKISKQENIKKEVILVDDGSNDNSRNIISNN